MERLGKPAGEQEAGSFAVSGGEAVVTVTFQGRLVEAAVRRPARGEPRCSQVGGLMEQEAGGSHELGAGGEEGQAGPGGVRGVIVGPDLSRSARRRFQKDLARLGGGGHRWLRHWDLTYAPEVMPERIQVAKAQLRAWLKRALRKYPKFCGHVRLEPQRGGVPHFHLLTWGAYIPHVEAWRWWREVTGGAPGRCFVWVEACRSAKAGAKYVSKYVSKAVRGEWEAARVAAAPAEPASAGSAGVAASLDLLSYWAAPGRLWGRFNEDELPFAEVAELEMSLAGFYRLRRSARKLWSGVGARRYCGFCLFTDDLGSWGVLAAGLMG